MGTATTEREPDAYYELVRRFPLRRIRTESDLDLATALIDELTGREDLTAGEREYLDILSDQVGRYEDQYHPIPPASDSEVLAHLMDIRGLDANALAEATDLPESTLAVVIANERRLSRDEIGRLAKFFRVSPAVFAFE